MYFFTATATGGPVPLKKVKYSLVSISVADRDLVCKKNKQINKQMEKKHLPLHVASQLLLMTKVDIGVLFFCYPVYYQLFKKILQRHCTT